MYSAMCQGVSLNAEGLKGIVHLLKLDSPCDYRLGTRNLTSIRLKISMMICGIAYHDFAFQILELD